MDTYQTAIPAQKPAQATPSGLEVLLPSIPDSMPKVDVKELLDPAINESNYLQPGNE